MQNDLKVVQSEITLEDGADTHILLEQLAPFRYVQKFPNESLSVEQ